MAQSGYTPILIYASGTATNVPLAANLTSSASGAELALNYADGKLYFKNSSGVVTLLAGSGGGGPAAGSNTQIQFNNSGVFGASANLTWSGTVLATTGLTATGAILHNTTTNNQSYTTTGAGTITISSGTTGTIDGMNIGATTAGTGRFSSITNTGLTSGRVVYSTTGGLETDSANLTFNGTTLTANTIGAFTLSGTIAGGGNQINNVIIGTSTPLAGSFTTLTASTSITNTGLTSGRVVYSTTGGLETDSANLTFDGTNLGLAGGTANGVAYLNGSKVLTSGSALQFDGTNLGLNTASLGTFNRGIYIDSAGGAYAGLQIKNTAYPNGVYFSITNADLNIANTNAAGNAIFLTNSLERMRINSSGNVGIGTSSPAGKLHIDGGTYDSLTVSGNSTNAVSMRFQNSAASSRNWNIGSSGGGPSPAGTFFIYDDTGSATRMVIDSSGNVGIGTTSPNAKLDVVGAIKVTLAGQAQIWNGSTGTYTTYQYNGTSNGDIGTCNQTFSGGATGDFGITSRAGNLVLGTGATERMRIDSSGKLLLGLNAAATGGLAQFRNASAPALSTSVSGTSVQTTPALQISKPDATTTTSQCFVQFYVSDYSTGSGQINANGGAAAAFGSFSDRRLKENITDLPSQLASIMALRPVEFDYIEEMGGEHQIGFIAQEVQAIYPDLVDVGKNEMLMLTDMNKNDARLIKCIQEQQALITSLTARITALEST